jgi:hypothetical protein
LHVEVCEHVPLSCPFTVFPPVIFPLGIPLVQGGEGERCHSSGLFLGLHLLAMPCLLDTFAHCFWQTDLPTMPDAGADHTELSQPQEHRFPDDDPTATICSCGSSQPSAKDRQQRQSNLAEELSFGSPHLSANGNLEKCA